MPIFTTVGLRAEHLHSGTYNLDQLETLSVHAGNNGLTLDLMTGNVLICGKRPGWTRRAREHRVASDLALLNAVRGSCGVMAGKPARQLVDQATHRVLHRNRPLRATDIRDLVRELRSLRRSLEYGQDLLRLRAAKEHVRHSFPAAPGADALLDAVGVMVRRETPETLLKFLYEAARSDDSSSDVGSGLSGVDTTAAVRAALGGPAPDFAARLEQRLADPDLQDVLDQLRWLSVADRRRNLHPDVNKAAAAMLDLVAALRSDMAQPPAAAGRGWREPTLREACAALCGVPPVYRAAEAGEAMKEMVRHSLLPDEPFDFARTGDAPYQLGKYFEADIVREIDLLTAVTPDEMGGRRTVDFADLIRHQNAGVDNTRKFALDAIRRICGADRRGTYALSSVLNQTMGNSVLQALLHPEIHNGLGLTHIPVAFAQQAATKRLYTERRESGDYIVSMDWQSPLLLAGRWDARLDAWTETVTCDPARSRFAMSLRLRLTATDVARGVCKPQVETLSVGMGFVQGTELP